MLLSASASALKISQRCPDVMESFINVHKNCKRAHPNQILEYKHSILLHKIVNTHQPSLDWVELNENQTITSRETYFRCAKTNLTIIRNNLLSSRLAVLNKKVLLTDLNMSLDYFKVKYKQILMSPQWNSTFYKLLCYWKTNVIKLINVSIMYYALRSSYLSATIKTDFIIIFAM